MKIAGFTFGKKHLIIVGVLILLIIIISKMSDAAEEKKRQEVLDKYNVDSDSGELTDDMGESDSYADNVLRDDDGNIIFNEKELELLKQYDIEQQSWIISLGFPPEGYEWSEDGELIAVSSDELTAEDVIYGYLRNLSMLDFATAGRYVSNSSVITSYKNYYVDTDTDIRAEFTRKLYKLALKSIEVEGLGDISVFEDGTEFVTVYIKCLDMSNKDFWSSDRDKIFVDLYKFSVEEQDSIKMQSYLYDYVYNSFLENKVPKKTYEIELVLSKGMNKGWLLSDDLALYNILINPEGNNICDYIFEDFNNYLDTLE